MGNIQKLVDAYQRNHAINEDWKLSDFRKQTKTLKDLIEDAVWGREPSLKQDRHQHRLPRNTLDEMTERLQQPEIMDEFERCKCFDDLFVVVYESRVPSFGSLAVYDTSLRIGAIFGLYPSVVYLHQGALDGACRLLGKEAVEQNASYFCDNPDYPYIKREVLPEALHVLEPYHIENFLCINKNKF